jgi:O-antigen/teichoic acid export membrane protein
MVKAAAALRLLTPERLYIGALGLSGLAALGTIALVPDERGQLVVSITGATLGAAVGGLSIDTFVMSRVKGWVWGRGPFWVGAITVGCVLLSSAVAAVVIAAAGTGSYAVAIAAAACLTVFNVCSSLALRVSQFRFVYTVRAGAAAVVIAGYTFFYVRGQLAGVTWALAYLGAQAVAAMVLGAAVLRWAVRGRPERPGDVAAPVEGRLADLSAMTKVHLGVSAQMVVARLDQVLLARFSGAATVGVYALAVAALEFAQAGAVVRAQRILTRSEASAPRLSSVLGLTAPVAAVSLIGLVVLSVVRPAYHELWILGLLLLPASLAAALGKTWSAALLVERGENTATMVSVVSALVAVPAYFLLIPWLGAVGAAIAMSCAYGVYAIGAHLALRPRLAPLAEQVV